MKLASVPRCCEQSVTLLLFSCHFFPLYNEENRGPFVLFFRDGCSQPPFMDE